MTKKTAYHNVLIVMSLLAISISSVGLEIWSSQAVDTSNFRIFEILVVALRWGFPLLIAMTGVEVLYKKLVPSVRVVYGKYLPISAISCCIWWCLSALILMKNEYENEVDTDTFLECLGEVLEEPYNILFLQLIVCIYAFYPLLNRIVVNEKNNKYALIIFFMMSSLFPFLGKIPFVGYLSLFTNQMNWNFFTAYGMYVFMGVYVINVSFDWYKQIVIYCAGLLSTVAMYSFTNVYSFKVNAIETMFIDINSPLVAIQVFAVLVFAKQIIKKEPNSIFEELSKNKYGFIPMFMVSLLILNVYFTVETLNIVVAELILSLGSFAVSMLLCSVLRRIPLLNKVMLDFDDRGNAK